MRAGEYRYLSIVGIAFVLLGNTLVATLWIWALFSTPSGAHGRYMIEAGLSFAVAAATFIFGLPFVVVGFTQRTRRVLAFTTLILAFTPVPLGMALMNLLAHWRNITLSP